MKLEASTRLRASDDKAYMGNLEVMKEMLAFEGDLVHKGTDLLKWEMDSHPSPEYIAMLTKRLRAVKPTIEHKNNSVVYTWDLGGHLGVRLYCPNANNMNGHIDVFYP